MLLRFAWNTAMGNNLSYALRLTLDNIGGSLPSDPTDSITHSVETEGGAWEQLRKTGERTLLAGLTSTAADSR